MGRVIGGIGGSVFCDVLMDRNEAGRILVEKVAKHVAGSRYEMIMLVG